MVHRSVDQEAAAVSAARSSDSALISFAQSTPGEIYVTCFRYSRDVAMSAVEVSGAKPLSMIRWDPDALEGTSRVYCDKMQP